MDQYGVQQPPVDPVTIARHEGVEVVFVKFTGEYDKVSGFYEPDENRIYVNKDEFPLRQTFTVAHELAHALLHRHWAASDEYRVLLRDPNASSDEPHEKEANAFAAHLLVPRKMLDTVYSDLSNAELSKLFAVSVPTIKYRKEFEYGI